MRSPGEIKQSAYHRTVL